MADVQQLIQKILSDPKIAGSSNFADRVYRDQPILITAPQMERYTPPKIREMRKIAKPGASEAEIFHEQGKFMEDFEDTLDYRGEFVQYFPTYRSMTDIQLRGYFSWRAKVRKGMVEKTSLSFAFIHIYELLNQIGVRSPEDGFRALRNFWTAYGALDSRIDGYVALWLKDYVIYHNLDKSMLDGLPDVQFDNAVAVLLNHRSHGAKEVFSALNSLSSYDLEESLFFKRHPDDVMNVVRRVFAVVSDYYNRNPRNSAREKLFGRVCVNSYDMFKSAVFRHRPSRENRVYEIGACHRYVCQQGDWSCERFVWYGRRNKRIGALLKSIDYLMRRRYGHKSTLRPGKTNKTIAAKIENEIARHEQDKRESAPPKVDIDLSKLHAIRTTALVTQSRLLVEEAEAKAPPAAAAESPAPVREDDAGLSEVERRFVRCLLHGEKYDRLLQARGLMPSVLMDGINEKLFDRFNDTVIVEGAGGAEVREEYAEELKGMLPR